MRYHCVIFSLLCACVSAAHAAEEPLNPLLSLDELRVPVFPAFSLLGVTPTDIERPSTARAFAVGLLSASERSAGDLPTNLAMEIAPYWWSNKPDLTFDKYYSASLPQRMAQSFAVSLATSDLATFTQQDAAKGTALSIGARTMILGGRKNPKLGPAVEKLKAAQLSFLEKCVADPARSSAPPETEVRSTSDIELSPECAQWAEGQLRDSAARVTSFDRERIGLVLEAAAGAVLEIPDDNTSEKRTSKYGGWLTWSYRGAAGHAEDDNAFTWVALQRWLRDDITDSDVIDVGARLIYKVQDNQWAVSCEYLKRFASETPDSSSTRLTLEYVLSERYTLTAALGRNFRNGETNSPLIAIAGLSIGWGGAQMKSR